MKHNLVISAFGAVTPLGGTFDEIKKSLFEGKSGIKEIKKFNTNGYITHHAGIPDEGNHPLWPNQGNPQYVELIYTDLAAERLLNHPQFPTNTYAEDRIGCLIGVDPPTIDMESRLNMHYKRVKGDKKVSDIEGFLNHFRFKDCIDLDPTTMLAHIHQKIPFSGYAATHIGVCSASLQVMGLAVNAMELGLLDAVIVGGISAKISPLQFARLELLDVISTDTNLNAEERSRPFDKMRSGFVLSEGAVLFLLEKEENVLARGQKGLIKILGYGASLGAEHIIAPHRESLEMILAMQRALKNADVSAEEIDLINAHGTSTQLNDHHEAHAIHHVFKNNKDVMVNADKSLHGHLIATAGAMELLNIIIASQNGFIQGSINIEEQDSQFPLNIVQKSQQKSVNKILKNSFGMGGLAASLVLEAG